MFAVEAKYANQCKQMHSQLLPLMCNDNKQIWPVDAHHLFAMSNCSIYVSWVCMLAGAKLFYLSGMKNGKYMKREVLNLARFISVMKFRPLSWRQAHPYLLTDRLEVRHDLQSS